MYIEDFFNKNYVLWKEFWLFRLFSEDKGDYIDVWIVKMTIKTNEVDRDFCFF